MVSNSYQLWKQPNFLKLWSSQTLNSFAEILLRVVVMLEVYRLTNSVLGAASVFAFMSLSSFISSLIVSRIIDNYSMKKILFSVGWLRGILVIAIGGFIYIENTVGLTLLFLAISLYSFAGAWYQPARFAILPLIIPREQYIKANGTLVMIQQLLMVAGWGLGGVLAAFIWYPIIISVIAVAYVVSGLFVYLIKVEEKNLSVKKNTKRIPAWKEVWRIPVVRGITMMETIEGISNAIWTSALLLAFATVVLNAGEEWWGFLNAGYFVGAILGSIIVTFNAKILENKIGIMIGLSGVSMGVLTIIFSFTTVPIIAVLLCVLMGPMYQARDICQVALLQDAIPEERRAGIMAARSAFLTPWNGIMVLIVGFAADVFSVQMVYLIAGILYFMGSLLAFQQTSLRNYEFKDSEKSKMTT
ncbi:MFS transporter [Alteribacter aurantiacus]|uniref:MFS transporter n=1 Tax=Alteribacter aurantiacus TaxID=254410 RepID=UPI0004102AFB|nr:MFS transporter [Alteribacter aurantiacus]